MTAPETTRCAGSTVWADPPIFDGKAICSGEDGCYQLVPVIPDGSGFRLGEHSRPIAIDQRADRLYVPEFDETGRAA